MIFHRKEGSSKALLEAFRSFDDLADYIRLIVDTISASAISRDLWLTDREKEFFIATVINFLSGNHSPISDESLQIYKKYFNPKVDRSRISDYINRVVKRQWIVYDKMTKEIILPETFRDINMNKDVMDFKLRFYYEGKVDRSDINGDNGEELVGG